MQILQNLCSYKVLLPLAIILIILYSIQRINNFIGLRGMVKEYIKIFNGSKIQISFFFGIPFLLATSFVQLGGFSESKFNTLYVVMTMMITMLFSILTVLTGYRKDQDEEYKIVLKETKSIILFELILSIFIIIYAFIFQMSIEKMHEIIMGLLNWILYYLISFDLLNLFIVIKRYKKLDDVNR